MVEGSWQVPDVVEVVPDDEALAVLAWRFDKGSGSEPDYEARVLDDFLGIGDAADLLAFAQRWGVPSALKLVTIDEALAELKAGRVPSMSDPNASRAGARSVEDLAMLIRQMSGALVVLGHLLRGTDAPEWAWSYALHGREAGPVPVEAREPRPEAVWRLIVLWEEQTGLRRAMTADDGGVMDTYEVESVDQALVAAMISAIRNGHAPSRCAICGRLFVQTRVNLPKGAAWRNYCPRHDKAERWRFSQRELYARRKETRGGTEGTR